MDVDRGELWAMGDGFRFFFVGLGKQEENKRRLSIQVTRDTTVRYREIISGYHIIEHMADHRRANESWFCLSNTSNYFQNFLELAIQLQAVFVMCKRKEKKSRRKGKRKARRIALFNPQLLSMHFHPVGN